MTIGMIRGEQNLCPGAAANSIDDLLFPSKTKQGTVAVLGLGNTLLSDEGVGVHAATILKKKFCFLPAVDIIDGGTMGLDLLPLFQDRDRILIVDAVDFGKLPGYTALVEGEDIPAVLNSKLSVHHIGVTDLLLATRFTRETPLRLCLAGIQPCSLEVGLDLTTLVQEKLDDLLKLVHRRLTEWGITVVSA